MVRVGATKGEGPKPRNMGSRRVEHRKGRGRTQKNGAPKDGALHVKGGEPTHFALFSSQATIFFLSSLFWVYSRGMLVGVLKRRGLKCARLEFSGCRVKPGGGRSGGEGGPAEGERAERFLEGGSGEEGFGRKRKEKKKIKKKKKKEKEV